METPENTPKPPGVSIDRNTAFESGLEYNKEHFYRMIGERGYEDFMQTGIIQAAQETKKAYVEAYFFKGQPLSRYANSQSRVQYFVEVKPNEGLFTEGEDSYPHSARPVTTQDEIRVYRYAEIDGAPEIVFDSFKGE